MNACPFARSTVIVKVAKWERKLSASACNFALNVKNIFIENSPDNTEVTNSTRAIF